MSWKSNTI